MDRRRSVLKTILGRLGLVLMTLCLGALALEFGARLAWRDEWQDLVARPPEGGEGLPVLEGITELAAPRARGINRGVLFRTNQHGLRGPDRAAETAPGVFRIAITGDSTTMGSGVPEEDRYSDVLARLLNEGGDRRYEVLNTGLGGLNTAQGVTRLERMLQHYRARLLVYGFSVNDIEGPHYETSGEDPPPQLAGRYWERVRELEHSRSYLWRYLGWLRLSASMGSGSVGRTQRHNYEDPAAWGDLEGGLEQLRRLARLQGVCAHVLIHTRLEDLGPDHAWLDIYERVERAAARRGLGVTQTFPYLEGREADELWVSLFDSHPNRIAHQLYARALLEGLRSLPAECWSS